MKRVYYHCTHKNNIKSILELGLQLKFAHNQSRAYIWTCLEPTILTAQHVADKHEQHISSMVWLSLIVEPKHFIIHPLNVCHNNTALKTKRDIMPDKITVLGELNTMRLLSL